MSELEKEEFNKRASALTQEERAILVKYIPSEIMLAELGLRLSKKQKIIDSLKQIVSANGGEQCR